MVAASGEWTPSQGPHQAVPCSSSMRPRSPLCRLRRTRRPSCWAPPRRLVVASESSVTAWRERSRAPRSMPSRSGSPPTNSTRRSTAAANCASTPRSLSCAASALPAPNNKSPRSATVSSQQKINVYSVDRGRRRRASLRASAAHATTRYLRLERSTTTSTNGGEYSASCPLDDAYRVVQGHGA